MTGLNRFEGTLTSYSDQMSGVEERVDAALDRLVRGLISYVANPADERLRVLLPDFAFIFFTQKLLGKDYLSDAFQRISTTLTVNDLWTFAKAMRALANRLEPSDAEQLGELVADAVATVVRDPFVKTEVRNILSCRDWKVIALRFVVSLASNFSGSLGVKGWVLRLILGLSALIKSITHDK